MKASFIPVRTFFGLRPLAQTTPKLSPESHRRSLTKACQTARERRRAVEHARKQAHRAVKQEIDSRRDQLLSAVVSVPAAIRERCLLTPRMARVKVFLERQDLEDLTVFRGRVRTGLVRLFPELEQRSLLRISDGFDMKVGGGDTIRNMDDLRRGLEKCENLGNVVFVEVIPHNAPRPRPPLSARVREVFEKASATAGDPNSTLHMISFFKFTKIEKPDLVSELLHKVWSRMGIKGRVYVAEEGVNAQLAVPDSVLSDFRDAMNGSWIERGETIVPSQVVGIFLNIDSVVPQSEEPFEKLSVRAREKVLSDGFSEPLDWNKAGKEISPREWHELMSNKQEDVILLDCRNSYESDVGRFEGAEPLNTRTFRESWPELEKRLKDEDRGKKVLTYCTGGIRCVKVNAFLEQKMGFTSTGRLQGGIVSYARALREDRKMADSTFKGVNHVFDGRMGEVITEDLLHACVNCGQPCNVQTDCANVKCPRPFDQRMFGQCEECAARLSGACSESCQKSMKKAGVLPERAASSSQEKSALVRPVRRPSANELYADLYSATEEPLLQVLRQTTEAKFPKRAHMLSSHTQALLLKLLVHATNASDIIEIGTFTGYATLAMASALPQNGVVVTCEIDDAAANIAEEHFARQNSKGAAIDLRRGPALETLRQLSVQRGKPFDFAFIDADKGCYRNYVDYLIDANLIRVGGFMAVDNVLFRGEVAYVAGLHDHEWKSSKEEDMRKGLNNMRSVGKIAGKLHTFNEYVKQNDRLEQVILPFRDGLTIARRLH